MTTAFILGFFITTFITVYFTPRLIIWTMAMLIYMGLVYYGLLGTISHLAFIITAIFYLFIAVFFNIKPLRYSLSKIIYLKAKKIIPAISETEKLALNAGDPWYEKEIFNGKPNFNLLHNSRKFSLSQEEQSFLDNETAQLCSMINEWQVTHIEKDLSVSVWNFLREKRFFGLIIKKEYGGRGFSAAAHSEIVMKVATRSVSAAVTVMVPNSLGPGELLHHYGTLEQKNYYLPRLAQGIEIPCFALTGPTAGSDAASLTDKGVVAYGEYNGQQVLGIKLSAVNKRYITLAPIATLVGLAVRLEDPDNLLAGVGHAGITCVLLPHDHPGLEIGNRLLPLNQVFMNGTVRIKESFIPIDWIIGGQAMAGNGWKMLVECLAIGRSISLPACGTANALFSTVITSAYSAVREQFRVAIGNFEGVQEQLAKMGGLAYMMNATRQFTVCSVDAGIKPAVASAISKYHLTENGRIVLNAAMDIHAGRGIIMGPNNYLASAYEGVPIGITVEGANIMTRNLLIYGQGMMQCHPYLRTIYESLTADNSFKIFDKAIFGFVGSVFHNIIYALWHSFTCGVTANGYKKSKFNQYYKKISRLSSALAFISDSAIILLGGELKRKERISARLGDAMSYLYMACSILKYFKDNGERVADEVFVKWGIEHCLFNAQNALLDTLNNFRVPLVGCILKIIVFPYGAQYKKPSDKLEYYLSQALLANCETRKVFKAMCYVSDLENDLVGRVEYAYRAILDTYPIKAKIQKAIRAKQLAHGNSVTVAQTAQQMGIITEAELAILKHAIKLADEVIQVDEFAPYELGPKNAHPQWQAGSKAQ
ncbi:MAG: acyl-CoA dehydrogenase [Burkholderiales bacterium]|nr:acyl-CoA dehydrogenase [Burkholderiales bacterium]